MTNMIDLTGVGKRFPGSELPLLDGVDLAVGAGEVVVLTGPVGAGKSTLLAMIHGGAVADRGAVQVFGRDVGKLRRSSIAHLRRRIGIVTEDLALVVERTAFDNVALPLEVAAVPRAEIRRRVAEALGRVGLALQLDVAVARLSFGERQRVALARAIVGEPQVLLCDQPTAHQHDPGVTELAALLAERAAAGVAVLVATSDPRMLDEAHARAWAIWALGGGALHPARLAELDPGEVEIRFDSSGPASAGAIELPNVLPFPTVRRAAQGGGE